MSTRLGPFRLETILGRGGMGTVWSASVIDGDARVAVKTLTAVAARESAYVRELNTEVRAMAAMTHPNIALVLDHGLTPEDTDHLPTGSPWLAMELASGGSLASARPKNWDGLRAVLLDILAGLAHAHARGIIHRDIKPANVLLCTAADLRPGYKVADFGIARAADSEADSKIRGTPQYMAPEQFRGHWRDHGPWTDLYAVGCLAWELASGHPPFSGNRHQLRNAHLQRDVDPLLHAVGVPLGFEAWARGLLEKSIDGRVQRAAEAARSLIALGDQVSDPTGFADAPLDSSETWSMGTLDEPSVEWTAEEGPVRSPSAPQVTLPQDWRPARPEVPTIHLRGVGLGLFMLRTGRVVGRSMERDRLWKSLSEVVATGSGQAVVLHGATGVGKSRLALWLANRAHEVGCTELPLIAHADPNFDDDAGLARMIREALGADDTDDETLERRLRRRLIRSAEVDEGRIRTCMSALSPNIEATQTATEHRVALAWLMGVLARHRPLIIWLEDVQWSTASLRFISAVLDRQTSHAAPILLVATVREEALTTRPGVQRLLERLEARTDAHRIEIGRMESADVLTLVRDMLGVDGVLSHHVSLRADGNPLYATQLVGSWARNGLLEKGPGGFTLPDGADMALPDDLSAVWVDRLRGIEHSWPDDWRASAELAALLGGEFGLDIWTTAADTAGLANARTALDVFLSEGLLWPADQQGQRLVFVHGMIREVLVKQAVDSGRAPGLHRAIAEVLHQSNDPEMVERLGRHLLEGEQFDASLEPLWEGSERRRRRGQYGLADALLGSYERALLGAGAAEDDERWITAWRNRSEYARMNGDAESSLRRARRAAELAATSGRPRLRAEAIRAAGLALFRMGRRDEAHDEFEAAIQLAEEIGHRALVAHCHTSFSYLLPVMGRVAEGEAHVRVALQILQELEAEYTSLGNAWNSLSTILVSTDRLTEAAHASDAALAAYQEAGNLAGIAMVANDRGDLLRKQGRFDEAEASYALSIATYAAVGAMQQHIAELNIAIVHLEQGRWRVAHPHLQRCVREFRAYHWAYVEAAAEVGLAACAIAEGAGDLWDQHVARAAALWATTGVDVDFAIMSELAAKMAEVHDPPRAKSAWALAADQWDGLGRVEEAKAARSRAR